MNLHDDSSSQREAFVVVSGLFCTEPTGVCCVSYTPASPSPVANLIHYRTAHTPAYLSKHLILPDRRTEGSRQAHSLYLYSLAGSDCEPDQNILGVNGERRVRAGGGEGEPHDDRQCARMPILLHTTLF